LNKLLKKLRPKQAFQKSLDQNKLFKKVVVIKSFF